MRYPTIKVIRNRSSTTPGSRWKIEGLRDETGKRIRKFFASKDQADEWLREKRPELRTQGRSALTLTDFQRTDAKRAIEILAPFSASLTEAAQDYADRAATMARSIQFSDLIGEIESTKRADGKSENYIHNLIGNIRRVKDDIGDKLVAEFNSQEIDDWLRALDFSPTTRNNYRRNLSVAFSYAISRGYCQSNPMPNTAKAKAVLDEPGILFPVEFEVMLNCAPPTMQASLAIAGFAGIREAEIARLDWSDINLTEGLIAIKAAKAKTASRRVVPILPALAAWLAPISPKTGSIHPANYHRHLRLLRPDAIELLKKCNVPCPNLESWPANALRHSFISYRLATEPNAALVALEAGHNQQMLHAHYKALVSPKEGKRWFALRPAKQNSNVVKFSKAVG